MGLTIVMQQLFLVRHCATEVEKGRFVGSTDVSIAAGCEKKIAAIAGLLPQNCICYCSPMLRTLQTHALLCKYGLNQKVMIDERVKEIDFGRWELKNFEEISHEEPEMIDDWKDYQRFVFPDGDSVSGFMNRVASWLNEIREDTSKNIVLVAHGGVIRYLICLALQIPTDKYLLFDVKSASLTTINLFPEGGVLTGFNI